MQLEKGIYKNLFKFENVLKCVEMRRNELKWVEIIRNELKQVLKV